MTTSKRIAGLLDPTLVAIAASEAINLRLLLSTPAPPVVVYLAGALLFVAGLAIVRDHNHWSSWPVLVTLTGWLAVFGGLIRMFAPAFAQQHAQNTIAVYVLLAVLFAVGVFLTLKAYRRDDNKSGST